MGELTHFQIDILTSLAPVILEEVFVSRRLTYDDMCEAWQETKRRWHISISESGGLSWMSPYLDLTEGEGYFMNKAAWIREMEEKYGDDS